MKEASVLQVLKKLKVSTVQGNCRGFSFQPRFGICWHLFANTEDARIGGDYLIPVFLEMELDSGFPVECQIVEGKQNAFQLYNSSPDKFCKETISGKTRLILLDSLIVYFEKKVQVLSEVQQAETDLGDI